MFNVLLLCVSLWLTTPQLASCQDLSSTCDTSDLPIDLFSTVNDALYDIKVMLDDAQQSIKEKEKVCIDTIIDMNYSTGDGGPLDSQLAVVTWIYKHHLDFIDGVATEVAIQMTQLFLDAINKVATLLKPLLKPDRAARTVKLLKFVIFEIAPKIGKVTAANKNRYWDIYELSARKLVRQQIVSCLKAPAYLTGLTANLQNSTVVIHRYTNEVGFLVDQFASEVAGKLLDLIREALNPAVAEVGTTVEPWVNDDDLDL